MGKRVDYEANEKIPSQTGTLDSWIK